MTKPTRVILDETAEFTADQMDYLLRHRTSGATAFAFTGLHELNDAMVLLGAAGTLTIRQWNRMRADAARLRSVVGHVVIVNGKAVLMGQRRYRAHLRKQMPMTSAAYQKVGQVCVPYPDPKGGFGQGFGKTRRQALWRARRAQKKAWRGREIELAHRRWGAIETAFTEMERRFICGTSTLKGTPRGLVNWKPTEQEILDLEASRCYRASGSCLCPMCGAEYRAHPYTAHRSSDGMNSEGWPYMHRLCNGDIVEL